MKVISSATTSTGKKRGGNQDSYLVDEQLHLYLVCDGMGGHRAGEVASALAVQVVHQEIAQVARKLSELAEGTPTDRQLLYNLLRNAVRKASEMIHERGQQDQRLRGMGTTLTLLLLAGQRGFVAHVGDSRLYLYRNQEVHQITTDHSLVNELVRAGKLEAEKAADVPFTNALTRAVGVYPNVAVDLLELDLLPDDCFLLCSDGLHTYLRQESLLDGMSRPFPERSQWFVDFANGQGGTDNITAVMVEVEALPDERKSARLRLTFDTLHKIPLFHHLSYSEMVRIMAVCRAREVEPSEVVIRQGEKGDALYIVLEGSVNVWQQGRCVATLDHGRHFGEMSLVDNKPRSATVIAVEKSTLIRILKDDFYNMLRQDSVTAVKLLWNFIQTLSHRMRELSAEVLHLAEDEALVMEPDPYASRGKDYSGEAFANTDPGAGTTGGLEVVKE